MKSSVGKPLLGLMAAACIAVPSGTAHAAAALPEPTVREAATGARGNELFDPTPPILRLTPETSASLAGVSPSSVEALAAADPTRLLKILTFPYHNIYGIGTAVGAALNSALMVALLPVGAGYYVLTNQADKIPAYVDAAFAKLNTAIPNIFAAIQNEIAYDRSLFNPIGSASEQSALVASDPTVNVVAADPTRLLKILTFPYHNIYAVGTAVGAALNSALMVALLPVGAGYYVLTNQADKIPAYIDAAFAKLNTAIPNIFTTIQSEIAYDKSLFNPVVQAKTAPEKVAKFAITDTVAPAPATGDTSPASATEDVKGSDTTAPETTTVAAEKIPTVDGTDPLTKKTPATDDAVVEADQPATAVEQPATEEAAPTTDTTESSAAPVAKDTESTTGASGTAQQKTPAAGATETANTKKTDVKKTDVKKADAPRGRHAKID